MKKVLGIFAIIAVFNFIPLALSAFETDTHRAINEYIAQNSINGFSLDQYLKDQIGFPKGVNENVLFQELVEVYKWIGDGGKTEDITWLRSCNHFHDPVSNTGFSGIFMGFLCNGDSSTIWAQKLKGAQDPGGYYSWFDTRDFFYKALTTNTETDRDKYFAETFRGIGQLMHLVQDISVPAHVRNQAHIGYHYEGFVLKYQNGRSTAAQFQALLANPYRLDASIFTQAVYDASTPVPISALWDQNKYTGGDWYPGANDIVGLAEYTNANFFSDFTIFQGYPHPRKQNTSAILVKQIAEDGKTDKPYYIKGYQSEKLALYSYFANLDISGQPIGWEYTLDDTVYEDYAQKLIPRAVGYSADLLNYFFRGNIEITRPDNGVYSQTDPVANKFTKIVLFAKNITSNGEEMPNGTIELVVKYRLAIDDPFQISPARVADEYTYIVVPEANGAISIPRDTPAKLEFDLSQNPIPLFATYLSLNVVYKGKLGLEDGAVAVGYKDISEPTPIDIYNNCDKICINGTWYDAGGSAAVYLTDTNKDGIADAWDVYPHDIKDIYIKTSPEGSPQNASPTNYDYYVPYLAAGKFLRAFYILTDRKFNYSLYTSWLRKNLKDPWINLNAAYMAAGTAIRDDSELYPNFYTFRRLKMWWGGGFKFINKPYPEGSECQDSQL